MDQSQPNSQEQAVLWAIAASSLPLFSASDRQRSFQILEEFKKYDGRIQLCLNWLHCERQMFQEHDITLATKLLALEVVTNFLSKGSYSSLSEADRLTLRQAVLKAARMVAVVSPHAPNVTIEEYLRTKILAKKVAAVLEGLVVRDFPQRWTSFTSDVFTSVQKQGGLWYDEPGQEAVYHLGVRICLECLKLVAEDCTDADFNAKISTQRRSDVLIGLNEVSEAFLPHLFQLLEHYPILQQAKASIFSMHKYLLQNGRKTSLMTPEEDSMYQIKLREREGASTLISDTLVTLEKFCASMPVKWILGSSDQQLPHDFCAAMMHLLREPDASIQVRAAECLEQLCLRGKLEMDAWMRFIREIPNAVAEANQLFSTEMEHLQAERAATGSATDDSPLDQLTLQLDFHRTLSRFLANVVASNLAHVTTNSSIMNKNGHDYDHFTVYLKLLVQMLHHPCGRICTEQVSMWVSLLRDPQIAKAKIIEPYLEELMVCIMDQMVKIRWEDVDNQTHPLTQLFEASFDDEDDYDAWVGDLRSRSSILFKLIGNVEPHIAARVLSAKMRNLIFEHGNGQPINFVEASNNQLTQKSDAVMQFEGLVHPLENTFSGIPSWTLESDSKALSDHLRTQIRASTRSSFSELALALVGWNPSYVWLKFRRAQLLESLKYFWVHDPSTLLQAVDSLLRNLGLSDEWNPNATVGDASVSGEITSLKKKSGISLVAIAKKVPHHLVPWLSQLSEATSALLSSDGLIPMNQMHLYEFLTCVATAVVDPVARSNFIGEVMLNAVQTLESAEIQQSISSVSSLLSTLGVTQARDQPEFVTNSTNVKIVTSNYNRLFNALNRLLSVGRRCNEAARKWTRSKTTGGSVTPTDSVNDANPLLNFPDEGPVSVGELAERDPFVPLWPRILPHVLQIYEVTLGVWRPEHQSQLLQDRLQRYVYAISDDEAYLAKTQDGKSGGVFGEGGTAGSVVAGTDRRDNNLVPKWSGWFNELRNCCFQLLGLLAAQRVLYAPEIASMYPRLVAVIADPVNMSAMEHRHLTQFLKHIFELLLVSCPSTMYTTHLAPLLVPICEHLRVRLERTWQPVLNASSPSVLTEAMRALTSADAGKAAILASQGGDAWFTWYYAHAGLFVGDMDVITAEAAVDKYRVEIGRTFSDVLQVALALKGEWALVLANQAKEEQALKRNDSSKLSSGPNNRLNEEGVELNADGTPKSPDQYLIDGRKLLRINGLCHFLLLENEQIAGQLTLAVIQCLGYPDAYTCRRITKVCHRILETTSWSPQYSQLLGQHMFTQAVKNVVTEPKWMVGMEWDMINGT